MQTFILYLNHLRKILKEYLSNNMFFNQKFIMGMLTNFGSMALERIHNTLKVTTIEGHTH